MELGGTRAYQADREGFSGLKFDRAQVRPGQRVRRAQVARPGEVLRALGSTAAMDTLWIYSTARDRVVFADQPPNVNVSDYIICSKSTSSLDAGSFGDPHIRTNSVRSEFQIALRRKARRLSTLRRRYAEFDRGRVSLRDEIREGFYPQLRSLKKMRLLSGNLLKKIDVSPMRRRLNMDVLLYAGKKQQFPVQVFEIDSTLTKLRQTRSVESRRSPPPIDTRNPIGVTLALQASWTGIGYLMGEKRADEGGGAGSFTAWIRTRTHLGRRRRICPLSHDRFKGIQEDPALSVYNQRRAADVDEEQRRNRISEKVSARSRRIP
ncbi:hypothetical protein EVAR_67435_1 [Eumeta japonica]|uniref:Uncharacterized protein n=1 Tax=Eumeta variegata TaxID=151549 RepID=A0A4C2A1E2_EUMVA|nr:hypothetical protein EVAR_67435_1 [Eumeta japonica]